MATNLNRQISGWLEKIEANLAKFAERTDVTEEERIEFIGHQYHLVMLIHKALAGKVIFTGAKPVNIPNAVE